MERPTHWRGAIFWAREPDVYKWGIGVSTGVPECLNHCSLLPTVNVMGLQQVPATLPSAQRWTITWNWEKNKPFLPSFLKLLLSAVYLLTATGNEAEAVSAA